MTIRFTVTDNGEIITGNRTTLSGFCYEYALPYVAGLPYVHGEPRTTEFIAWLVSKHVEFSYKEHIWELCFPDSPGSEYSYQIAHDINDDGFRRILSIEWMPLHRVNQEGVCWGFPQLIRTGYIVDPESFLRAHPEYERNEGNPEEEEFGHDFY